MTSREIKHALRDSRGVKGWFLPAAAALFGLLDEAQKSAGIHGDLFEIGAHHGKSAVLLGRMARDDESVGVCDIFESQEANASKSGAGDRATFDRNMRSIAPAASVRVYEKPSSALTPQEIGSPYRIFHIDGGHLAEEALADLQLAAAVVDQRGLIVVDDPFAYQWPGVTEGILAFCHEQPEFQVVALGFNKLVLARDSHREMYDRAIIANEHAYIDRTIYVRKTLPVAGAATAIFLTPSDRQMPLWLQTWMTRVGWASSGIRRRWARVR
jgi:hypothetical protein